MTAVRWWVKSFARWQARIDSIKGQIQAVSLGVTAFSTFSLVLQGFGLGRYVPYIGVLLALGGPVYAYLYFEGGVWNQVARDRQDMSSNFASPSQRIGHEFTVRGLMALEKGEPLSEEERQIAQAELNQVFRDRRDGFNLEDVDD